ncbi:hypothetical protein JYU03_00205, partial [bacterium AH-315-F03]|nr:hypothetical protein [bacterium AH-315-F03]
MAWRTTKSYQPNLYESEDSLREALYHFLVSKPYSEKMEVLVTSLIALYRIRSTYPQVVLTGDSGFFRREVISLLDTWGIISHESDELLGRNG